MAKRAATIDDHNEYAHWTLGLIQLVQKKHDMAIAELKRAVELNPNCSLAYGVLGTVLSFTGEPDESIKYNEIAIRLNPKDLSIFFRFSDIAMAHFVAGRYSDAVLWARKSIYRKSVFGLGHAVLISSLAYLNRLEEAKEAVRNFLEIIPKAKISGFRQIPFKIPENFNRLEEGLRRAGLPE